jgi:Fis family transcriptional regulator
VSAALRRWLAERLAGEPPTGLYQEALRLLETTLLAEVMRRVGGNRWQAARWLGLNRATVRKKLAELGLTDTGPMSQGPDT